MARRMEIEDPLEGVRDLSAPPVRRRPRGQPGRPLNAYDRSPDYIWSRKYKVLIIKSTILERNHPTIIPRLNEWSRLSCSFQYNSCQMYRQCTSFVCLALDEGAPKDIPGDRLAELVRWLDTDAHSTKIGAMCIGIAFDQEEYLGSVGFSEIYSVCTRNTHRRKGYASRMLNAMTDLSLYENIWLGVEFENPEYDGVVSTYLKAGFGSLERVNRTPAGGYISKYVLGMTCRKSDRIVDRVALLSEAKRIKAFNEREKSKCVTTVNIGPAVIKRLHEYITDYAYEYSGVLSVDQSQDGAVQLAFPLSTERIGRSNEIPDRMISGEYTVLISASTFNFHTHPVVAYIQHLSYIGWPSGMDMRTIILQYLHGLRKHFLPTNEGIYDVQLSTEFMHVIRTLDLQNKRDCIQLIAEAVGQRFSSFEKQRTGRLIDPNEAHLARVRGWFAPFLNLTVKKRDILLQYLYLANNYTIKNLIDQLGEPGTTQINTCVTGLTDEIDISTTPIFIVNFSPWKDITGGYRTSLVHFSDRYSACPLQVNTRLHLTQDNQNVIRG